MGKKLLVRNKFLWVGIDIRFTPLLGLTVEPWPKTGIRIEFVTLYRKGKQKVYLNDYPSGQTSVQTHVRPDKRPSRQTFIQTNVHPEKRPSGHTYIHWIFVFRSI